jgi:hypothetical protein
MAACTNDWFPIRGLISEASGESGASAVSGLIDMTSGDAGLDVIGVNEASGSITGS